MFGKTLYKNYRFWLVSLSLVLFVALPGASHAAALRDSDFDGLTDEAELYQYSTDPKQVDTDHDGVSDSQEILEGTEPLNKESSTLARWQRELTDPGLKQESLAWYIGRASGIAAFILMSIVVINGLLMSTRLVFHFLPPALNYDMHHFFAWGSLFAVTGHFVSFFFDRFIRLTWHDALVPFGLERTFPSALGFDLTWAVGIGTVAFYLMLTLVVTSKLKGKVLPLSIWRKIHFVSFGAYLLMLVHGITAGTDSRSWWMLFVYALSAGLVFGLTGLRIYASLAKRGESPKNGPPEAIETV